MNDLFNQLKAEMERLEKENNDLREENARLEKELNEHYGSHIDTCKLSKINTSSELIELIEGRYANTGMKVIKCSRNRDDTFILELGPWNWRGKVSFIGKQYFMKKIFSCYDPTGYDDPGLYISEILGIHKSELGFGGIAENWRRERITIPEGFIFDKIIV